MIARPKAVLEDAISEDLGSNLHVDNTVDYVKHLLVPGRQIKAGTGIRNRINTLLAREDFKKDPARAIFRRLVWRIRWKLSAESHWLISMHDSLCLLVPNCGMGALVYYQGASEPDTADFIRRFLQPGMSFVDIGAHLGEYSVLASGLVTTIGEVHAFEPHPQMRSDLEKNLELNHCTNVRVHCHAVCNRDEDAYFELTSEPALSSLSPNGKSADEMNVVRVPTVRLDQYFSTRDRKPDLIKVDVEGAELQVLQGSERILTQPASVAPVIIFEYEPANTMRFGYLADEILEYLTSLDYDIYGWRKNRLCHIEHKTTLGRVGYCGNLIAAKLKAQDLGKLLTC